MGNFFRVQFGIVSRSAGHCAAKRSAYQACTRVVGHDGKAHDFRRKAEERALPTIMLLPDGAPGWAHDPQELWRRAAEAERRTDAQEARIVDLSIPREVPPALWSNLLWHVYEPFRNDGMAVQLDVHDTPASDGGRNVNAHGLLTLRRFDGGGFARRKERAWNDAFRERDGRAAREIISSRMTEFCRQHSIPYAADARPNGKRGRPAPEPQLPRWNFEAARGAETPPPALVDLQAHRARRRAWNSAADAALEVARTRRQIEAAVAEIESLPAVLPAVRPLPLPHAERRAALLRRWQGGGWIDADELSGIAFVRYDAARGALWIDLAGGGTLLDTGDRIALRGVVTWQAAKETAAAAARHGWTEVEVSGSPAYKDAVSVALALRGIPVTNHDLSAKARADLQAKRWERAQAARPSGRDGDSLDIYRLLARRRAQRTPSESQGSDWTPLVPSYRPKFGMEASMPPKR